MLRILAMLIISKAQVMICMIGAPGVPIPGSEFISQIFANRLKIQGSLMNFVRKPNVNDTHEVEFVDDNLDISVLDMNNFRRMIKLSKNRNDDNFRRQFYFTKGNTKRNRLQTAGYKTHLRENPSAFHRGTALYESDRHVEKIYQMMKQSIFVVRDRAESIKKIRSYFEENPSYKLALLDSAVQHYLRKIDYYSRRIMKNYERREHFLWYLILYEKVLQCNIDLNYAVERSFQINRNYYKLHNGRPPLVNSLANDDETLQSIFEGFKANLSNLKP